MPCLRTRRLVCAILSVLLLPNLASRAESGDIAVIVNPTVNQASVARNTLGAVFGMRMRLWPDGQPIRVVVLADDDPLHVQFCKSVLQVFAHQMRHAWDRGVFSGTGQAPILAGSEEELIHLVASTPGAIGYAMGSALEDEVVMLDVR